MRDLPSACYAALRPNSFSNSGQRPINASRSAARVRRISRLLASAGVEASVLRTRSRKRAISPFCRLLSYLTIHPGNQIIEILDAGNCRLLENKTDISVIPRGKEGACDCELKFHPAIEVFLLSQARRPTKIRVVRNTEWRFPDFSPALILPAGLT
jgi:hypothetical protein